MLQVSNCHVLLVGKNILHYLSNVHCPRRRLVIDTTTKTGRCNQFKNSVELIDHYNIYICCSINVERIRRGWRHPGARSRPVAVATDL